jgi:hypothetical protein
MIYPYPQLRQNLVGAWCPSLGASGYTLADRSGYGRNGSLTTSTFEGLGSGNAVRFGYPASNNTAGYAGNIFTATPTAAFTKFATLSLWVKKAVAVPTSGVTYGANGGWFADGVYVSGGMTHYPYSDGICYVRSFRSARVTCGASLVDMTQWHHVCITTDGTNWRIYQNGRVLASATAEASVAFTPSLFMVGKSQDSGGWTWLDGWVDGLLCML